MFYYHLAFSDLVLAAVSLLGIRALYSSKDPRASAPSAADSTPYSRPTPGAPALYALSDTWRRVSRLPNVANRDGKLSRARVAQHGSGKPCRAYPDSSARGIAFRRRTFRVHQEAYARRFTLAPDPESSTAASLAQNEPPKPQATEPAKICSSPNGMVHVAGAKRKINRI